MDKEKTIENQYKELKVQNELRTCPFCGKELEPFGHDIDRRLPDRPMVENFRHPWGEDERCALSGLVFFEQDWNSRPIEDALREERDAARKVAFTAFHNISYFNWQTWTLHHDEIEQWVEKLKIITEAWRKRDE